MRLNPTQLLDTVIVVEDIQDEPLTLRSYFKTLLTTLWQEGQSFSGKRPFGNSGWEWDLALSLVKAGVPVGTIDEDGYIEDVADDFDDLMLAAIDAL